MPKPVKNLNKQAFRIDLSKFTADLSALNAKKGKVKISLPVGEFACNPTLQERTFAAGIMTLMNDRRILCQTECCYDCYQQAVKSIREITDVLEDKQFELAATPETPLFILLELQLLAIRQFLRYDRIQKRPRPKPGTVPFDDALELLRSHLCRCLNEVAKLANVRNTVCLPYDGNWPQDYYIH